MLRYRLYPENPCAHIFCLELEIQKPQRSGQILSLANWIPGSYLVRNFAKHITSLSASSNGKPIKVKKLNKNHWQCGQFFISDVMLRCSNTGFRTALRTDVGVRHDVEKDTGYVECLGRHGRRVRSASMPMARLARPVSLICGMRRILA